MGAVPYSGRIILYFSKGGSREFILLGKQDGPAIRDRLRPLVVGARLPWWHRWVPRSPGQPAHARNVWHLGLLPNEHWSWQARYWLLAALAFVWFACSL